MTKEQKELLLKDLCGRLPYGVKCAYFDMGGNEQDGTLMAVMPHEERLLVDKCSMDYSGCDVLGVVPYLFPLSSMTKEQNNEFYNMIRPVILEGFEEDKTLDYDRDNGNRPITQKLVAPDVAELDWLNANHFDYRGLIEQDLAIDATGLNIYKEERL